MAGKKKVTPVYGARNAFPHPLEANVYGRVGDGATWIVLYKKTGNPFLHDTAPPQLAHELDAYYENPQNRRRALVLVINAGLKTMSIENEPPPIVTGWRLSDVL